MSNDLNASADVPDPDAAPQTQAGPVREAVPTPEPHAPTVATTDDAPREEAEALASQSAPVAEQALSSTDATPAEPAPATSEAAAPAIEPEVVETPLVAAEVGSAPAAALPVDEPAAAAAPDPSRVEDPIVEAATADVVAPAEAPVAEPPSAVIEPAVAEPPSAVVEPGVVEPGVVEPASAVIEPAVVESPAPSAPTLSGPRPSPAALAGLTRPAPPRPVAASAPAAAEAPVVAPDPDAPPRPTDSETFGRVDDDGTVHVRLSDGSEHPVGQWAAGTPTEGLAFFVRKYDDLSVEVDLAARRLAEGKATPEQAAAVVKRARESLASPSMVGDLGSLTARVDALDAVVVEKRAAAAEARAAAKAAALAAREAIVAEAEALAESTQWKSTGERFKTLLDDWKAAPRADRTSEQALWKRFSHARSQFDKHRRQYFARLDSERGEAKQVKEALVAEAESLQTSTDWGASAGAYRDLMSRWKASGRAGKSDEEALWTRFRAAQDAFFAARNAALGQRDAGFAENLAAKEALLAEAEAIDASDLKGAKAALRSIQERWEKIGHVPRGDKERVEGRLRKVEDAVRNGEQEQWRRSNPESRARASATVEQFSASLDKLEKQHTAALTAGDARKATDLEGRIATTKALLDAAEKAAAEFSG